MCSLDGVKVKAVLARRFVGLPSWPSVRASIIGRATVDGITPEVEVPARIVPRQAALLEPFMFIARVIEKHVEDDSNLLSLSLSHKAIEIVHAAETGMNAPVIANAVAVVGVG